VGALWARALLPLPVPAFFSLTLTPPLRLQMNKWRSITYVCVPSVIALTTYMMATQEHPHAQEPVAFPYLRLRSKVRA